MQHRLMAALVDIPEQVDGDTEMYLISPEPIWTIRTRLIQQQQRRVQDLLGFLHSQDQNHMCSSGLINSFHGDSPSLGWYDFLVHRKIPESHTKSYLEGKFPVICRGRSENSKILGRIVSVHWRSTGSWDGAIQSGYCLFCCFSAHLRRDADNIHLHFIYMKFIKRVFGSRQHSQQVPVQSLTSTELKNKKAIEDEFRVPRVSQRVLNQSGLMWGIQRFNRTFTILVFCLEGEANMLVRFQTCPRGSPRISSCFGPESYKSGERCLCHMFDGFKVPIKCQIRSAPFKDEWERFQNQPWVSGGPLRFSYNFHIQFPGQRAGGV